MAKKKSMEKIINMDCPECGEDLTQVGVVVHSRCHQTARVTPNGAIVDHDDLEIDAPDENQDIVCGQCTTELGDYLNEDGLLVFPEPEADPEPATKPLREFAEQVARMYIEGERLNDGHGNVIEFIPAGNDTEIDALYGLIRCARQITGAKPIDLVEDANV